MHWMLLPLRRYADFSGRSRPREYWMFVLFVFLASIVLSLLDYMLGFGMESHYLARDPWGFSTGWSYVGGGPVLGLFSLAILIPSLAVAVRRLHDSDHRGWWLLIGAVPFVGWIVLFVFMVIGGTRGPNRFGPDPVQ